MGLKKFLEKIEPHFERAVNYRDGMHCTKQPPPSSIPWGQLPAGVHMSVTPSTLNV